MNTKQTELTKVLESLPEEMKNAILKLSESKNDDESEKSWKDDLIVDSKGNYKPFIGNYRLYLENLSKYNCKLIYNNIID